MEGCEKNRIDLCDQFCPSCQERVEFLQKKTEDILGLSELFKALADETRTKIIYLLSYGELCVCDLSSLLGITLPAVSHHLRLLKAMNLVRFRREGKQVFYHLDDDHILQLIRIAREHFLESKTGAPSTEVKPQKEP